MGFFSKLEKWEKGVQVILVICLVSLITLQLSFTQEPFRFYLSFAERLEGIPWEEEDFFAIVQGRKCLGSVKIVLCGYFILPRAVVLINGQPVARFTNHAVLIDVKNGDEIRIDGSAYSCPLTFRVEKVSPGVAWPMINYQVKTEGSVASLGKVEMK